MEKVLLSLSEVSEYITISIPCLRKWITKGKMPIVRAGRRVLVSKAVLDARIAAGNLAEAAPQEGAFQKVAAGAPISLDKT